MPAASTYHSSTSDLRTEPRQQPVICWCTVCRAPIAQSQVGSCPLCGSETRYLTTDVRPVFSRERRILQFYGHGHLVDVPVWKAGKAKTYYVDGRSVTLPEGVRLRDDLP